MIRLRFVFRVFLKRIASPTPALEISPAVIAPKEIAPRTYALVITADDAQLGISPISEVINGAKYFDESRNTDSLSAPISPLSANKMPKTSVTARTYANV